MPKQNPTTTEPATPSDAEVLNLPAPAIDLAIIARVRKLRSEAGTPSDEVTHARTLSPRPRIYVLYKGQFVTLVDVGAGRNVKERIGLAESVARVVELLPKQRGIGYEAWLLTDDQVIPIPIVQGTGPGLPDMDDPRHKHA